MNIPKKIKKTAWIVLVVILMIEVLFDPLSSLIYWSENVQGRVGLPVARRKWESLGITHYQYDVRGYVPNVCIVGGSVEVENGVVIHTGPSTDAIKRGEPDLDLGFWYTGNLPLCNYKNYTIPAFFDIAEQYSSYITQISFDPKYGFVTRLRVGSPGRHGLFSMRLFDSYSTFRVFNFVILDE